MKVKKTVKETTNRGEFNRAYKEYLERKVRIHCSRCRYHKGENYTGKWYGAHGDEKVKLPNWKLVSKNPKQWMEKPLRKKIKYSCGYQRTYVDITW